MKSQEKLQLTRLELSWILYDVGNSAFTMLACSLIPIWFKAMAIGNGAGQITSDRATAYWALATSIVTIFVALLGPVMGVISDLKDRKRFLFITMVAIGVGGCVLNGFVTGWLLFLIVFVITKIAYSSSLVIYDSMLNDITSQERMDEVSSFGFAWGYLGSCIPFLIALAGYAAGPDMLGLIPDVLSKMIGFGITGGWWLIVTLPLIKNYRQIYHSDMERGAIRRVFSEIGHTLVSIATGKKQVLFFLLAFFLYIDGVDTIIDNCINVGTDLGLNTVGQVVALLVTQVIAFAFSLVFARLSRNHETVTLIKVCIIGYIVVCLYALTLHSIMGFALLALGVGMFQGSIQSMSRSYFAKIIPPEKSGEYFGIYDIFSKGASFLGSAVLAGVKLAGGTANMAIASLAVFFVLGYIFLWMADRAEKKEI